MRKLFDYIGKSIDIFFKYLKAKLLSSLILGILTIICLGLIKIKYFVIIGLIVGVLNIIPYLGSIISMVIAGVISYLSGDLKTMFITLLIIFILQQIEGGVISTKLMGDALDISPLFVFIIVLIGGSLFGIIGLIFAVPVAAIIKYIYKDRKKEYY